MESRIIDHNPTIYLTTKGGGVPQEERQALTDEQAERLWMLSEICRRYVFVMIGLYAGLRRGRNSCSAMGFSISGYGYSISDGKACMGTPNITDR